MPLIFPKSRRFIKTAWPLLAPRALAGGERGGGVRGKTARKAVRLLGCFLLTPQASPLKPASGCSVLAPRATLLCRCASANRGCFLKPPTKVRLANQRGLTFDLSRIGCSAPGASSLASILSELRAFAVSLGRFPQRILDQSSCFFQQRIDDCRVMNVDF